MTREEMRGKLLDETASYAVGQTITHVQCVDRILALFDRYEEEQWSKAGEKPTGPVRRILVLSGETINGLPIVMDMLFHAEAAWDLRWRFRELPTPPSGGKG